MARYLCFSLRSLVLAPFLLLLAAPIGCATPKPEPEVASSATQPGYAQDYPTALEQIAKDFGRDEEDAQTLATGFFVYAKDLKAPDWKIVTEVYRSAKDAGRSRAYVDRNEEIDKARLFFSAEQDDIAKKVGGWASYACKQRGAEADLSGTVSRSLSDLVSKRLEKRLRERNDAHTLIDRRRHELSKEDAAALEVLADQISRASYLVHVAMMKEKVALHALVEEAEQVKKTLVDYIAAEQESLKKASKEADKVAIDARIDRASRAEAQIDGAVSQARQTEQKMDERIHAAQKRFQEALDALIADADKKAK